LELLSCGEIVNYNVALDISFSSVCFLAYGLPSFLLGLLSVFVFDFFRVCLRDGGYRLFYAHSERPPAILAQLADVFNLIYSLYSVIYPKEELVKIKS
jgi:hypothetical protein